MAKGPALSRASGHVQNFSLSCQSPSCTSVAKPRGRSERGASIVSLEVDLASSVHSGCVASPPTDVSGKVDEAALAAAAVGAVLTTVLSGSENEPYGWLSTGVGFSLAALVSAYYRPRRCAYRTWPRRPFRSRWYQLTGGWDGISRATAFGSVTGLLITMIVMWPVQHLRDTEAKSMPWVWLGSGALLTVLHVACDDRACLRLSMHSAGLPGIAADPCSL